MGKENSSAAANNGPALITLHVISGPCEGLEVSKQTKKFMLGRTKTTAVCIKDDSVSQRHADVHNLHDGALLQVGIESQLRVEIKSNEAPPDKPPPAATKSKPPVASKPQSTAAKATKGGARSGKSLDVPEVEAPQTETEKDPADPAVSIPAEASVPIAKAPTTSARPPPAAKAPKDSAPPKVASPSPQREPESMEVDLTVEQYLSVECDRMAAQITERVDGLIQGLRDDFTAVKTDLMVLA